MLWTQNEVEEWRFHKLHIVKQVVFQLNKFPGWPSAVFARRAFKNPNETNLGPENRKNKGPYFVV